jgi:hypothetical protein
MSYWKSSPFLKMMAFCSSKVYYLESEHVLSQVVPILEDDGVLLVAPHLVRQRIRVLPHLRKGNNFRKKYIFKPVSFIRIQKAPKQRKKKSWMFLLWNLKVRKIPGTLDSRRNTEH